MSFSRILARRLALHHCTALLPTNTALHCTALHCYYCTVIQYTEMYCTVMQYIALYCRAAAAVRPTKTGLHITEAFTALFFFVTDCTVLHCTVLYYTALYCDGLHCNCTVGYCPSVQCM